MSLKNKTILITGATGGLGPSVVERFYHEGCSLVLSYLSEEELTHLPEFAVKESDRVLLYAANVTNEKEVSALYQAGAKKFGTIDIVCNIVGGYMPETPVVELSLDDWNKMLSLNLTSCFLSCREAMKHFSSRSYGRIFNIAAKPGIYAQPKRGSYAVAKAGVAHLTKILGKETKKTGITVNAIAPSVILTEANKEWGSDEEMKHWVTPQELAGLMVFLCSDDARSINGTIIEVFGGV